MIQINWDAVLTAGATAAIVTLTFEYLAKPRLEARKQRIVDAHKMRQDFERSVRELTRFSVRYTRERPEELDSADRARWDKKRRIYYRKIEEQIMRLDDSLYECMPAYSRRERRLRADFFGAIEAVDMSNELKTRKAEIFSVLGEAMVMIQIGSQLRYPRAALSDAHNVLKTWLPAPFDTPRQS